MGGAMIAGITHHPLTNQIEIMQTQKSDKSDGNDNLFKISSIIKNSGERKELECNGITHPTLTNQIKILQTLELGEVQGSRYVR